MNSQPPLDSPELYELAEHWEAEPRAENASFRQKARVMDALFPDDVQSVLDVGCGDGALTHLLKTRKLTVGLERSFQALKYVQVPRVLASADRLPFGDKSFDAVLCSEVLEHLPTTVFETTVGELNRVAARYLMISVPFRDNLQLRMCRCADCRIEYNAWGHVRTFDEVRDISKLFPAFALDVVTFCGPKFKPMPGPLRFLTYTVGGRHAQNPIAICPHCHSKAKDPSEQKWITYFTERIYWRLPIRLESFWVVCLFRRPELLDRL